jgi:hypothetical protein
VHFLRSNAVLGTQLVCWGLFAAYRIVQALSGPAVWQDSEAYRAVAAHGLLSGQLWVGARAPLVPALMDVTGRNYDHYALAEGIAGLLAWTFLAWTASHLVEAGWRALVVFVAVLGFATAPLVVMWDWSALSESPSLSALAMLCALGLLLLRKFTWLRLSGLAIFAAFYVGLRDADIWVVGLVGVVVAVIGIARTISGAAIGPASVVESVKKNVRVKWHRTRALVVTGAVLVAVSAFAAVGAYASHRNVQNIEEAFYVRVFPFPDRVAWFSAHGMPEGAAVDALGRQTPPPTRTQAQIVAPDFNSATWQPLRQWFSGPAETAYLVYLVTHPAYEVSAPFSSPPLTYNNAQGHLSFYDAAGHLSLSVFEMLFAPGKVFVFVMALVAVVVAWYRRVDELSEWRFLVAFAIVGVLSMLIAWHGEGQEVTRHMVEGNVEVRLGVLLTLVVSLFGTAPPRRTVAAERAEPAEAQETELARSGRL